MNSLYIKTKYLEFCVHVQFVTCESECRNWHFATFEKFAIKVWGLSFLTVLCRIDLKFSIWNNIISLKILKKSDDITLSRF